MTTIPAFAQPPKEANSEHEQGLHLVVMTGANVGQLYTVPDGEMVIGRDDDATVQILDGGISRRHAKLTYRAAECAIEDLGSRNGTKVNGQRVEGVQVLRRGDKIQLGAQTVLRLSHGSEPETHYARQMHQAALRDALTGMYNRRYLEERLVSEVAFGVRHRTPLALVMFDIDHFKSINDAHGHPAGDAVLRQLAGRVAKVIRTEDVLARYGGEEFAVVCRETNERAAAVLAERIRKAIEERSFSTGATQLAVTVSLGVADTLQALESPDASRLLAAADAALYSAKRGGRNRVVGYSLTLSG